MCNFTHYCTFEQAVYTVHNHLLYVETSFLFTISYLSQHSLHFFVLFVSYLQLTETDSPVYSFLVYICVILFKYIESH